MQSNKLKVLAAAVAVAAALPMTAQAGSSSGTGPGALSANVDMGFNVVIPRFVFLRVGNPAGLTTLVYSPTVADMANSTSVIATGGDADGGANVTVQVRGNAGDVTLTASALANLANGPNNIPTSTLTATNPLGSITVPAFGGNVVLAAGGGGVVSEAGEWRYTWANQPAIVYAPGTYTGIVTYTATTAP